MNIDLNKANLGQLQYISQFTEFKTAAQDELHRRLADVTCNDSQAMKDIEARGIKVNYQRQESGY